MNNNGPFSASSLAVLTELDAALCCCCSADQGSSVQYSEVQDDCSIVLRQLGRGQLLHCWQSCLRSGEILVRLLHKSEKIQALLSAHGCPLLPLQEGTNNLDWCNLRSRFLGNWCNILNVMRYMQKKCPGLRLQCLGSGTGEAIVDGLDDKKSEELVLIALAQCLTLLYSEKILAPATNSGATETGSLLPQGCRMQYQEQQQKQSQQPKQQAHYQPVCDFNNNAGQTSTLKGRQRQQQKQQQQQQVHAKPDPSQQKTHRQPQPKMDRLKDGTRVTCVYDTTTEETTARSPAAAAAPAAAPASDSAATAVGRADGDCNAGGANLQSYVSLDATAFASVLRHLDLVRSILADAAGQGKEPQNQQQQQPKNSLPSNQASPLLQKLQQHTEQQQKQQKQQQNIKQHQKKPQKQESDRQRKTARSQNSHRAVRQQRGRKKSPRQQPQRHQKINKKSAQKRQPTDIRQTDGDRDSSTDSSEQSEGSVSDEATADVQTSKKHHSQRKGSSGVEPKTKPKTRPAAVDKSSSQKKSSTNRHGRRRQRQRLSSSDSCDDANETDEDSGDSGDVQEDDDDDDDEEVGSKSNAKQISDDQTRRAWQAPTVDPIAPSRHHRAAASMRKTQPAEQPGSAAVAAPAMASIGGGNNGNDGNSAAQHQNVRMVVQKKSLAASSAAPGPALPAEPAGGGKAMTKSIQELIFRLQTVLSDNTN